MPDSSRPDIGEMMDGVFGGGAKKPLPVPEPKLPPKPKRYLPDISLAIAAQKIYNPDAPPAPPMKAAPKSLADKGTGPAMDTASKWDKGNG